MRIRNLLIGAVTIGLLGTGLALATNPTANAAVPPAVAGNVTMLPVAPRIVSSPGASLAANETKTFTVAGKTFGSVSIPATASGVILAVSSNRALAAGAMTVWPTDAGRPGSNTVTFAKGEVATQTSFIALNDAGQLNVFTTAPVHAMIAITGYVTPESTPAAPVLKSIASSARKAIDVGGSFRTRSTSLGEVTLAPGTYDARVIASFTGLNNVNNTVPADVQLTGTVAITLGDEVKPDFSNNITVGGIIIPDAKSDTLTQDPTGNISTVFTLTEETDVHVRVFAYAGDSSQAGSGELKAGLDSATFLKVG